jgi:pimeloyl-ACP methyl ester carboxylesterase
MKLTAVLVHGTFARDAAWTKSDSSMAEAIRSGLGEPWQTTHFNWSGENSYQGRETASDELAKVLEALVSESEQSQVVVIAHSHGGNVAMRALKKMKETRQIQALVTLGTPILRVQLKNWAPPSVYAISLWAWFSFAIYLAYRYASSAVESTMSTLTFAGVLVATLVAWIFHFQLKKAKNEAREIQLVSYEPEMGNVPLLIIKHRFDEANLWLSALLVPQFMEKILAPIGNSLVGNRLRRRLIFTGIASIFLYVIFGLPPMWLFYCLILVTGPFVLIVPLLSFIGSLVSAHKFGFGGSPKLRYLFVEISIVRNLEQKGAFVSTYSGIGGMLRTARPTWSNMATPHSLGYRDPKAIAKVARWLKVMIG